MILWHCLMIAAAILYAGFISVLLYGLRRLQPCSDKAPDAFVSVIIAARNEAKNIAPCLTALLNQTWPKDLYEIIVVDDASADNTLQLAREFAAQDSRVTVLHLDPDPRCSSPKKRAIDAGIRHSHGEFLFFTDADCLTSPRWLEIMLRCFDAKTGLVASWLLVQPGASLLSKVEALDSLSLVLVGAAGFGLGMPFLANGANLAYRRSVFNEVKGFAGIESAASGDDDLFLHKVLKESHWRAAFAVDARACIRTAANTTWAGFFRQRLRWASKTAHYPLPMIILEVIIYLFFMLLFLAIPIALFLHSLVPALFLLLKLALDFIFISAGAAKINRPINLWQAILADLFQVVYILIIGILGLRGRFSWKGRNYVNGGVA